MTIIWNCLENRLSQADGHTYIFLQAMIYELFIILHINPIPEVPFKFGAEVNVAIKPIEECHSFIECQKN